VVGNLQLYEETEIHNLTIKYVYLKTSSMLPEKKDAGIVKTLLHVT
jgi:hypothetical protein